AQAGVAEQGADGGQPRVAGGGAVPAGCFQLVEEGADGGGVQVGQVQLGGQLAGLLVDVAQQQGEGVAVGGDGVRAGAALGHQPVGEEGIQERGQRGRDSSPRA